MEIRDNNKYCIFAPLSPLLDKRESERLRREAVNESRRIGFDLSYVSDCTFEFIDMIKELSKVKIVSIFNIPSDIFAVFNFNNIDKYAQIFVCEEDFVSNTRSLINRKFKLV